MDIKNFEAEYTYDYDLDVVNIEVKQNYSHDKSIDLGFGIFLDFDKNQLPVNLEIVSASKIMGIVEPPRRVDDEDSQTKKIIVFFGKFLLHRSPYDF